MKTMKTFKSFSLILLLSVLAACVTINIYFPAAQAEAVAEKIIDGVLGNDAKVKVKPDAEKGASLNISAGLSIAENLLNFIVPTAQAQNSFSADTPAVRQLEAKMAKRHASLSSFYSAQAIGFTRDGLVKIFNASAVSLKQRNQLKKLVAAENADRNALYREIANANGHPEWEGDVRATFATKWIDRANGNGWLHD